ncbi:MAG: hypothetical protein M1540_03415 [Candidatus Bathyarchaeota archaeon]|nr:hypothetical protein [Candidatus Bathyarchaeota archaeon]
MSESVADGDVLLSCRQLDRLLHKARLEGAIGYITYLCEALDEKKIQTLTEIDQIIRGDWGRACSAIGHLMMEDLMSDGFANGFMDNLEPKNNGT